jgi:predicted DNA-binding protein
MAAYTKRIQVLVAPDQLERLRAVARRQGRSVGALVREAVETTYFGNDGEQRLAAVERLAEMTLPVADWEQMERESIRWPDDGH